PKPKLKRPPPPKPFGPPEGLGLLSGLRHHDPGDPGRGHHQKLSGHLPQPPAGPSPLETDRPQPRPIRADLRAHRAGAADPPNRRPRPLSRAVIAQTNDKTRGS